MAYKQLTMTPPRLERITKAKDYRAKGEECDRLAETAYTPLEKQAWTELRNDWIALAQEANELELSVEAAKVPMVSIPPLGNQRCGNHPSMEEGLLVPDEIA
jgi:hypothetical protein